LGEVICISFAREGCNIAINYVSSADKAKELAARIEKEHGVQAFTIQGDMGLEEDCVRTVKVALERFEGLDIIVSNAGWTRFSTFADLDAPTSADWDTCFAVNVKAQSYLLREAALTFKNNADGGVMIMTSSIAGKTTLGSCMPYAVTKAAQLHLMRCLAATQGPKIRVNAVLPGLLLTEWGNKYPPETVKALKEKAWLKMETDLEDTAQVFVDIARNSSMTGVRVQVDAGLGQND